MTDETSFHLLQLGGLLEDLRAKPPKRDGLTRAQVQAASLKWATDRLTQRQPTAWKAVGKDGTESVTLREDTMRDWVKFGRKIEPLFL